MLDGAIIGAIIGGAVAIVVLFVMRNQAKSVPRFTAFIPFSGNLNSLMAAIDSFLSGQKFLPYAHKTEGNVYRQGNGFWVSPKFIKIIPAEGGVLVEAFISVYGVITGLEGTAAKLPKQQCQKVVNQLILTIQNIA